MGTESEEIGREWMLHGIQQAAHRFFRALRFLHGETAWASGALNVATTMPVAKSCASTDSWPRFPLDVAGENRS